MSKNQVTKIKRMISKLEMKELYEVHKYIDKRQEKVFQETRKKEEMEHINRLKNSPTGTKIIVKFGSLANHTGEIYKHGRKYVRVKLDNGEYWKIPYKSIDDRLDNESVKMTARSNQNFLPILEKVLTDGDNHA